MRERSYKREGKKPWEREKIEAMRERERERESKDKRERERKAMRER